VIANDTSDDMTSPLIPMGFATPSAVYQYPTGDTKQNRGDMVTPQFGLNVEPKLPYHDDGFVETFGAPPAYSM